MDNPKIFQGLKVAEFAWVVVGPSTSRYLADHGATVVKIESHKRLDTNRINGPFVGETPTPDGSMFYGRHNPNKYCISIDLQKPGGIKLAWKMIQWADIVTESFSPGTMEKWGLGYEDVHKVRPDVIYFSSSQQGRGGPHSAYAGYGQNAVNFSGFSEVTGWPDRPPSPPYGAYTDYVSCRFAAFAIMAALEYRKRTGKGQYLEQSQFESSLQFFAPPLMDYQINGQVLKRNGNRLPSASPHGVFPCRGEDRWIAIAVSTEEKWHQFCQAMDNPSLATQPEYASLSRRKQHEDELEKIVAAWTIQYTATEIEERLQKAAIPSSVVEKASDLYLDPQLAARRYFTPLEHPVMGTQKYEAQASFLLSKTPREITRPSPCVGEHNEYVFKELLGLTADEIAEYLVDGSITTELPGRINCSF